MHTRKKLLLALAAAGLCAAAAVPFAESTHVFVPELATMDGAFCRSPGAAGFPLVRLAQAATKKTEISPAAPAAAQAVSSGAAGAEPPLMQGLGTRTIRITSSSALARQYFDQGYRLGWGFNHDEAIRAFKKAQELDPQCAMCYWGEAWALGPNINVPMDAKANAPALAALEKAKQLASGASAAEQALIGALAERYSADPKAERAKLDAAYVAAMRNTVKAFPDDLEVATLYADALMNVAPWDYWEAGGRRAKPATADLVPTLERVLKADPDHTAAIHLYIHAVEASDRPRRAERYADKLAQLAPNAGHLVHMPAHIYFVVGRYRDSLATNLKAVKVDETYLAARKPSGVYPLGYYPHNVHFVMVSAQMGGDGDTAIAAAEKLAALIPSEAARDVLMLQPIKAAPYFAHAQFSEAGTVMRLPRPAIDLPFVETAWRYARGIASAQNGDVKGAARELEELERINAANDYKAFEPLNIPAKEVGKISAHVLRARIAQAGGDLDASIRELEAAIALQDKLPYMEPAYWYYPIRQTLGAVLLLKGDPRAARDAFGGALARTPNNAWALYGLAQAYEKEGLKREARAVEARFQRAWMGNGKKKIVLAAL
ncbi:MAG TPA: tetratricopeptide repeat protein [Burkholderiales bacterium]|nr:tetratricopeptide repeat protein [Burkholderiales bacterium]